MRIAISGVGLRSAKVLGYIKQAMPEIKYVGYMDPQPTMLEHICDPDDIHRYDSIDEMLSDTSPDLLFVGSPNHLHLEQIEVGLRAGVQVFSEKPVVTTMAQTWKLAELLREYGPDRVLVGLVMRYTPQMYDLRKSIKEGVLGEIVSMEGNEHIESAHGGFFMRDWRRYQHYSGGFMLEKCVHDIDLYSMIANSRPMKVASFGGRRSFLPENAPTSNTDTEIFHSKATLWEGTDDAFRSDADIIDFQTAIISYQSGASLAFHTNLNVPDQHRRFMVAGTNGMAEGDFQRGYLKVTDTPTGRVIAEHDYTKIKEAQSDHYGADAQMGRDVAAYMRGEGDTLPVSILDALEAGIAAMGVDQARETGQVVDLTKAWNKFDTYRLRA